MAVAPSQRRAAPKQRFGRPLLGRLSAGVARRERRAEKPEPEPTLASKPLRGGGVPGPLADSGGAGWELELDDEHRRSFVSLRREAFSERTLRQWWSALYSKIDWECPMVGKRRMPRSAAWLTSAQCKCTYRYGSAAFTSLGMEPWFQEITDLVCEVCGIQQDPNSCNANLYEDGAQAVGWHADDEPLFEATERDALIVSLSLGATRAFELRPNDAPGEVTRLSLHHGDLCTMEGLTQKHYRHRVPRGPATKPRINLTWRWVVAHDRGCPLRQPGRTAEDVMSSPSPTRLPPAPRPTKRPHPETTSSLAFAEISKEEKERREQRLSRFSAASGALGPGAPAAPRPAAAEVAKRRAGGGWLQRLQARRRLGGGGRIDSRSRRLPLVCPAVPLGWRRHRGRRLRQQRQCLRQRRRERQWLRTLKWSVAIGVLPALRFLQRRLPWRRLRHRCLRWRRRWLRRRLQLEVRPASLWCHAPLRR